MVGRFGMSDVIGPVAVSDGRRDGMLLPGVDPPSPVTLQLIDADLDRVVAQLHHKATAFEVLLADSVCPTRLGKADAFRFFRRLVNYGANAGPRLQYDTHIDYFVADSSIECHRTHLDVGGVRVKTLTMKEPPAGTFAHLLEQLYLTDKASFVNSSRFTTDWIGLGPYKLARWEQGSHMELTRFDDYAIGRPACSCERGAERRAEVEPALFRIALQLERGGHVARLAGRCRVDPNRHAARQRVDGCAVDRHRRGRACAERSEQRRRRDCAQPAHKSTRNRASVSRSTSFVASRLRPSRSTRRASSRWPLTHSTSPRWAAISGSGRDL